MKPNYITTRESRETVFFLNFESNRRIRWSAHRRFGY